MVSGKAQTWRVKYLVPKLCYPRMVVGLKEPGGQFQNGTLEEEYFGTSNKPRRKRPSEVGREQCIG